MSTLQCANIWFESTANNRIQYTGSNTMTAYTDNLFFANSISVNSAFKSSTASTNNIVLTAAGVWSAMAETTLTDAATVSWSMSSGFDYVLTLGGSRTMGAPTNTKVGQKGRLTVIQPASGGPYTLSWNSVFKFDANTAPVLSTAANAVDVLYYDVRASNFIIISLVARGA